MGQAAAAQCANVAIAMAISEGMDGGENELAIAIAAKRIGGIRQRPPVFMDGGEHELAIVAIPFMYHSECVFLLWLAKSTDLACVSLCMPSRAALQTWWPSKAGLGRLA